MARDEGRFRLGTRMAAALLAPALFAVGCTHGETHVVVQLVEPPPEVESAPTTAPETRGEVEPSAAVAPETRGEVEPSAAVAPKIRGEATPALAAAPGPQAELEPVSVVAPAVRGALGSAPNESPEPAPVPAEADALPYTHTVRWKGETLSLIALWYSGAGSNWTALAKADPSLDPGRIKLGEKILIPAELLRHRRPLPYEWVHASVPEGSGKSASPKPPSVPLTQAEPVGIREIEPPLGAPDEIEVFRPVKTQQPSTTSDDVELYGPRE
jgi:hypothetical protein